MRGPRRDVTARELLVLAVASCLVSVVMTWPLVLHLGQDIPRDLGDPLAESWQLAWGGHALAHQPLHFFDSNQFWPFHDTLAFSDALVGYAPAGLFGSGPHAAVFRYDLVFLFAYALAFFGAYLLARELGLGPGGAAVAGAAFAFAPFRLEQDGHMQVISSGGIPLALALGVRGYRLRRPAWVVAGSLAAAWQLSIGFTLGLPLAYLLAAGALIAAIVWWRRGRPRPDRGLAIATVAGAILFAAAGFALSRPYTEVADSHSGARRTPSDRGGVLRSALDLPGRSRGEPRLGEGDRAAPRWALQRPREDPLPGPRDRRPRRWSASRRAPIRARLRVGLGIAVLVVSVLALGFRAGGGLLWPYRLVYEVLPGWQAIRVPGRLVTFSSLGLALLAGAGAQRAIAASARRRHGRPRALGGPGGGRSAGAGVVDRGEGTPLRSLHDRAQPAVPAIPPSTASVPAPQLHLPAERASDNRRYILWSTDGFPKLVNGRSSLNPTFTQRLIEDVQDFPSRRTVELLARTGVRSVVLHADRTQGTPWQGAARRPVAGLPVTRTRRDGLVIYELR